MAKFFSFILFLVFVILALFFRFWRFGVIPPGLSRDEASHGYTAWSLLKTGKDEYSTTFPLSIKAFGNWRLPAYDYLTIPFVAIFGLNDWSIRLPSAIAGLITLVAAYFLAQKLQINALITLIILAFLPWHVHFSRHAHESNLGLTWLTLAVLFFLKSLQKPFFLLISSFLFSLTLYSYYGYFIFTPPFLLGLCLIYLNKLKKQFFIKIISLIIFLVLTGIIFQASLLGTRVKSSISFLTDPVAIHSQIELPRSKVNNSCVSKIIYNKPVVFGRMFLERYLKTFLPNFLTIKGGDHPLHNFPGNGNIFLFEYPLFLIGLIILIKKHDQTSRLILFWLMVTPIASSLTKDAPNSGRVSMMIIPLTLTITLGLTSLFSVFKNRRLEKPALFLFTTIVGFSLQNLYQNYFISFPLLRAHYWGIGYQQLVEYLNLPNNINKTVLTQRPNYSPYIYYLFYSQYDPLKYQQEAQRYPPTTDGFYHVRSFYRYQFADFKLAEALKQNQLIIVWAETVNYDLKEKPINFGPFSVFEGKEPPPK